MRFGIVGLPKTGKTTLFNLLTASSRETGKFAVSREAHLGLAEVPDSRLEALRELYRPRKFSPATVSYVDLPGLRPGESGEALDVAELKTVDGLLHVVRAFDDPEIPHVAGSVDPGRDLGALDLELMLADHALVERRLGRLAQAQKRGLTPDERREEALLRDTVLPALENERPVRALELDGESERRLRGFQLLSAKPMLVVWNVDEAGLGREIPAEARSFPRTRSIVMSLPIEAEISRLEPSEQPDFLATLGLEEPSLDRVIRASYELLGLISFFTVGEDEVKAWTVRRGTRARAAAGTIHSDLERGFIRAEVVPWDELVARGSLAACRQHGSLRLEGKDYEVADGEVLHVRFNV